MKLVKIILPNMEERIVRESEVEMGDDKAVYWQSQIESVYDGQEETFYENAWSTEVKVISAYYVHFNLSKLDWQLDGKAVWAYSVVVIDSRGDLVGMKVDTEEAPWYYEDESLKHYIPVMYLAKEIINKESL